MSTTVRNQILIFRKTDNDVARFINAAGITDSRHIAALGDLINTFKSFNVIQSNFIDFQNPSASSMMAMWIGLGASETQKCLNVMNPVDADTAFRLTPVGGASILPYGYYRDGTQGKYFNTHVKPFSHLNVSNTQLSVYVIEYLTRLIGYTLYGDIGCNSASKYCYIDMRGSATTNTYIGDSAAGTSIASDYGDGSYIHAIDGLYCGVRSGNITKLFKKGNAATPVTRVATWDSSIDIEMYLTAINNNGNPTVGEKACVRFASCGPVAIADSLQSLYSLAVNKFSDAINPVVEFFGDSLTEGVGASTPENRWTSVLSQQLDSFLEHNIGLASTRLQSMPDNSDPSHSAYGVRELLIPPKTRLYQYLIMNLGWNDLGQGLTDVNRFKSQYITVVNNQIAKGYNPSDIYIGNIGRAYQDALPVSRTIFDQFQQAIYEVCQETGCQFVDVYGYMSANDTGNLWNTTTGNTVHLNDVGNAAMAAFWKTQIKLHAVT